MGHFVALSLDWCTSWTKTSAWYPLRLPTISNCDFIFKFTLLLKTWKFLNYGLPGAPYSMSFHCLPCFVPSHALLICVLFSFWLSWYLFITKTAVRVCFFIWYGGPTISGSYFPLGKLPPWPVHHCRNTEKYGVHSFYSVPLKVHMHKFIMTYYH